MTDDAFRDPAKIAVYYEHPLWFERLFALLDERRLPYEKVLATEHGFDPAAGAVDAPVVLNRMSPSAHTRGGADAIAYTLDVLTDLELRGTRVINGARAYGFEVSKARQLSLLRSLGLPFPRTAVIHRSSQALDAAFGLRYPVVLKPNVGGRGAGVVRFDDPSQLAAAVDAGALDLGPDSVALIQEFVPKRGGHITRVEVLGGRFLYAIDVHASRETFDLCPADICEVPAAGTAIGESCLATPPPAAITVVRAQPPAAAIEDVERIARAAGIEVGGVEYLVDDRDGSRLYYDVNALSNFVADAPRILGFDPWIPFVDYLESEARRAGRRVLATAG